MRSGLRITEATLDVLEVLLSGEQQLYGLKIAKAAGRPTGSVFPILGRLEQLGWVTSEWERGEQADRGPRRRFYQLSGLGMAQAIALLAERRPSRDARRQFVPGSVYPVGELL